MVSQSLENRAEDQISPDIIETVEEYEARIQGKHTVATRQLRSRYPQYLTP